MEGKDGMAGYSKLYCIGGEGGFLGSDGVNPIFVQIWQGEGSRQWMEAHYFDERFQPLGDVKIIIPPGPDMADNLLDACIVFFPEQFKDCPSFAKVEKQLKGVDRIDFDFGENIPKGWNKLREEAREFYKELIVYKAELIPLHGFQTIDE